MMKCKVSNCSKTKNAKGYCSMHYARLRTKGNLKGRYFPTRLEVYNKYALPKNENGCIEWAGVRDGANRYGMARYRKKQMPAHRFSYELFIGKIPKDMCVLHKCDNRRCVNVDHLWIGTVAENNADRAKKCRSNPAFGERTGGVKLTETEVRRIRELNKSGISQCELGRIYGVTQSTIRFAILKKSWRHVE